MIILGTAIDKEALEATGAALVTGPVAMSELEEVLSFYAVDGVLWPYDCLISDEFVAMLLAWIRAC